MEKENKLFDKRFVHFMWDDELKGKVCFAADNMEDLIFAVENDGKCAIKTNSLRYNGNNVKPFHAYVLGANCFYTFAYYDPNYEAKWAYYKEGKKVQVGDYIGNWADCHGEPHWSDNCKYRIKPECPCEEGIDSKACAGCPQDEAREVRCENCQTVKDANGVCYLSADGRCKNGSLFLQKKKNCRPFKDCDELVEFWSKNYQIGAVVYDADVVFQTVRARINRDFAVRGI